MDVQRMAAFSLGLEGGNPAGVVLLDSPAEEAEMARVAAEVGYSETAFAVKVDETAQSWRVRYFSPESEVPFCGHATIALGAVLGREYGKGTYALSLNEAEITVDVDASGNGMQATLSSPSTASRALPEAALRDVLNLFGLAPDDLDPRLPPALINAGANHILLALKDRDRLAGMDYELDRGRTMMRALDVVTIMLVHIESTQAFNARNAFASGGVFEDPATGAAAAAFAGYLRDRGWPHGGAFVIRQGEDMGSPSRIEVKLDDVPGASVRVSGTARLMK
ncbi:MAG: PhzF family phenazine biosynthesis protein [Pseudomonadota bacterium]